MTSTQGSNAYSDILPDEIYVNGISQNEKGKIAYNLTKQENNITLTWNSFLSNCANMFRSLENLIKVDLSEFDSSQVTNMFCMFFNCTNFISIDLSNLNTSKLRSLRSMFHDCFSLISLDLSGFDTSSVTYTYHMFKGCKSLIFLNIFSFNENKLRNVTDMFLYSNKNIIYCINENTTSLIKNEIKSLNTSNDCSNICFQNNIKIDLENKRCVYNCLNNSPFVYEYRNICYRSCPVNTYISLNNKYLCVDECDQYYNYEKTACIDEIPMGFFSNNSKLKTIDKCHSDCKTCNKKEENNNSNCLTCPESKFFNFGNCISFCVNDYLIDSSNNKICKCPYNIKCKECPMERLNNDLCISCNDGYYPKYNDDTNIDEFINCYKDPDGYYLDNNIYKPCYSTCKKCYGNGNSNNNNCIQCYNNYTLINDTDIKVIKNNCYIKCEYYYYFDTFNIYSCTLEKKCPTKYPKIIKEKNKCIDSCFKDDTCKYEYNNICFSFCPEATIISQKNYYLCEREIKCQRDNPYESLDGNCIKECNATEFFNRNCKINNDDPSVKDDMASDIGEEILNGNMDNILENVTNRNEDLSIELEDISYTITIPWAPL